MSLDVHIAPDPDDEEQVRMRPKTMENKDNTAAPNSPRRKHPIPINPQE